MAPKRYLFTLRFRKRWKKMKIGWMCVHLTPVEDVLRTVISMIFFAFGERLAVVVVVHTKKIFYIVYLERWCVFILNAICCLLIPRQWFVLDLLICIYFHILIIFSSVKTQSYGTYRDVEFFVGHIPRIYFWNCSHSHGVRKRWGGECVVCFKQSHCRLGWCHAFKMTTTVMRETWKKVFTREGLNRLPMF